MVQDRLIKAVARRLQELGLPPSLAELEGFRDRFFIQKWVMVVRDGDNSADVHLIQPQKSTQPRRREDANVRRVRKNSYK